MSTSVSTPLHEVSHHVEEGRPEGMYRFDEHAVVEPRELLLRSDYQSGLYFIAII